MLTDVSAIIRGYGTPGARPIQAIDTVALSAMTFPAGSMGPKVEACIRFVRSGAGEGQWSRAAREWTRDPHGRDGSGQSEKINLNGVS